MVWKDLDAFEQFTVNPIAEVLIEGVIDVIVESSHVWT